MMKHRRENKRSRRAYDHILEMILKGNLPFGANVDRRLLSAKLGMSLLPIGEALQRLELEGLVESLPRIGTRVRVPRPDDIRGFYIVREALETQAARLFVEKASHQDRQRLGEMAVKLDALYTDCAESDNLTDARLYELRDYHMRFHMQIAEATGCQYLYQALQENNVLIFNWFYDRLFGRPGLPACFHVQLVEVLSGANPDAADAVMRTHIRYRVDELLKLLEPYFNLDETRFSAAMSSRR